MRWNLSKTRESPKSRLNGAGWIGSDSSIGRRYVASPTPDGNLPDHAR